MRLIEHMQDPCTEGTQKVVVDSGTTAHGTPYVVLAIDGLRGVYFRLEDVDTLIIMLQAVRRKA